MGVSGLKHSDVVKLIKAGGNTVIFKILEDGGQYVQVNMDTISFWPLDYASIHHRHTEDSQCNVRQGASFGRGVGVGWGERAFNFFIL